VVGRYRAGDWKAAIEALEKSMKLRQDGDSFDWFFRAMAHCHLGRQDEARKWYDKAVDWMEKNQPNDEELSRFRAEARELLGMTEKKDERKQPVSSLPRSKPLTGPAPPRRLVCAPESSPPPWYRRPY
jgi:tetratricopeptide (TPR) repeat protein